MKNFRSISGLQLLNSSRALVPVLFIATVVFIAGCASPPPPAPTVPAPPPSLLNNAPALSRFTSFEVQLQGGGTSGVELKGAGSLKYQPGAASFDVATAEEPSSGKFFVQPEECRNDPSEACKRRFLIFGRLSIFKTSLNCSISVRNDTAVGYLGQSLTGICQDRNSRNYGITLYSN